MAVDETEQKPRRTLDAGRLTPEKVSRETTARARHMR